MSETTLDHLTEIGPAAARSLPSAVTTPDRLAVICDDGTRLTYAELASRAARLAGALRARGVKERDVVAVVCENSPAYLEIAWACRLLAVYYVTINTHLGADEVAFLLEDSGATTVIASAAVPVTEQIAAGLASDLERRILVGGSRSGWEAYEDVIAQGSPIAADTEFEGAMLQYSSGTTGQPKGIKYDLRIAPATPADDMVTFLPMLIGASGDSTYLCPAPLYHTAPHMWTMALLRVGATVVLMRKFDPAGALALIDQHQVTHAQFVPTMFVRMLKLPEQQRLSFDVSSLQGVVHAAAPCPVEIKRRMLDWWGPIVHEYWSSTEGAGFTFITAEEWLARPGSVGKSMLGALHVVGADGQEVGPGEPGVIWAEGTDFSYHNSPDKDAESTSAQGWRSVGDIGRLDEDGYLYLTDRKSFMIISGGVNIYPQEAENLLVEHPKVLDAAVLGLPDEDLGQVAVAVVQLVDPANAGDELATELHQWCEERLARYKCPRRIDFTARLPRTETGKLLKRQLRDDLLAVEDTTKGDPA